VTKNVTIEARRNASQPIKFASIYETLSTFGREAIIDFAPRSRIELRAICTKDAHPAIGVLSSGKPMSSGIATERADAKASC